MSRFAVPVYLIATLALSTATLAGCAGGSGESETARGMIAPEGYRASIEAVEAVLYQHTPAGYGDPERTAAAMHDLYDRIVERERSPRVRDAAAALVFAAARADVSDVGYAAPSLHDTRRRWEGIRRELFGDAAWFRTTTPGVVAAQTPEPPVVDPAHLTQLEDAIARLGGLVEDGRRECDALGEPDYEPGMEGHRGRMQIQAWRDFHREWDDRLNRAARWLPPRPGFDGVTEYLMAYQEAERAVNALRSVPMGTGSWPTPFESQWNSRLDTARGHLDAARASLSTLH